MLKTHYALLCPTISLSGLSHRLCVCVSDGTRGKVAALTGRWEYWWLSVAQAGTKQPWCFYNINPHSFSIKECTVDTHNSPAGKEQPIPTPQPPLWIFSEGLLEVWSRQVKTIFRQHPSSPPSLQKHSRGFCASRRNTSFAKYGFKRGQLTEKVNISQ